MDYERLSESAKALIYNLRGDEPPDGEEFGPLVRVIGRFLLRIPRSSA